MKFKGMKERRNDTSGKKKDMNDGDRRERNKGRNE